MDMHKEIVEFLYDDALKDEFANLDYDDSLLELGIIDSVKMLDLINFIEEKYGITVDDDDLFPENFDSVNAIVNYIQSKK
ncbi:acyl carrier protein [candidate division KSB1 bacterium]|jgi:acyl carrier protein|nr:MAG: acyl carrier protein [candidate division KSB1 bacterium]